VGCDPRSGEVVTSEEGAESRRRADLIVVTDGARSAARGAIEGGGWLRSEASEASLGYKELMLGEAGRWFPFEPEAIHIWPRRGFFMVALPNRDGTFRATLVLPNKGSEESFERLAGERIEGFFARNFPDAALHAHQLLDQYNANPVGRIMLVEASSYAVGRAVLLGDAAHAMAPFLGQGVNAAFEDVEVLIEMLEEMGWEVEEALSRYAARREPEGAAASRLSMENYEELAGRESSRLTVLGKQLRVRGHSLLPGVINPPTVVMVNFLGMPYSEVWARQVGGVMSSMFNIRSFRSLG
jgi:kynurenine 3-monooxygenase